MQNWNAKAGLQIFHLITKMLEMWSPNIQFTMSQCLWPFRSLFQIQHGIIRPSVSFCHWKVNPCRPMSKFKTDKITKAGPFLLGAVINRARSYLTTDKRSLSKECTLLLFHTAAPSQDWVQEVMSACVPVRDKSDIPTKPFPKINKQTSPVCVHILTCPVPSVLFASMLIVFCK